MERITAPCKRKKYVVYACMPPKYTVVLNKFECPATAKALNGDFFVSRAQSTNVNLEMLAKVAGVYVVDDMTPIVICGTRGEFRAISVSDFYTWYTTDDGVPSLDELQNRWVTCVPNLVQDIAMQATFIPLGETFSLQGADGKMYVANQEGVAHGYGDFVVSPLIYTVDRQSVPRKIVNGLVFKDIFSNRGWGACLSDMNEHGIRKDTLPVFIIKSLWVDTTVNKYSLRALKDSLDSCADAEMKIVQDLGINSMNSNTAFSMLAHALYNAFTVSMRDGVVSRVNARFKLLVSSDSVLHAVMQVRRKGAIAVIAWDLTVSRKGFGLFCNWSVSHTHEFDVVKAERGRRFIVPKLHGEADIDMQASHYVDLIRGIMSGAIK